MAANTAMAMAMFGSGLFLRPLVDEYLPLSKFTAEEYLPSFLQRYHGAAPPTGDLPLRIEYRSTRCYQQLNLPQVSPGPIPVLPPTPTVQNGDTDSGIPWTYINIAFLLFVLALALCMYKLWSLATALEEYDIPKANIAAPYEESQNERLERELVVSRQSAAITIAVLGKETCRSQEREQQAYAAILILLALLNQSQRAAENAVFTCRLERCASERRQEEFQQQLQALDDAMKKMLTAPNPEKLQLYLERFMADMKRWERENAALKTLLAKCRCGAANGWSGGDDQNDDDDDESGGGDPGSSDGDDVDHEAGADNAASSPSDDQPPSNDDVPPTEDLPTDDTEGDHSSGDQDLPTDNTGGGQYIEDDTTQTPRVKLPFSQVFVRPFGFDRLTKTHQRKYERKWRRAYEWTGGDAQAAYDYCKDLIPDENQAW